MKIKFKNGTAEHQFSSKYQKTWRYPAAVSTKLKQAENFIQQASSLRDVAAYPPFHFHLLKGDRKGEWAINLGNTGYRVTLIPCDDEGNELKGGDILSKATTIKIILVTEVSNHYE